ncbi:MAG: DUF1330 domain-containing protein [Hyphomicrobiaceae bacterium]
MSALMIARITVKDPAKFQEYFTKTQQVAAPYGAELLVRGKADHALTSIPDRPMGATQSASRRRNGHAHDKLRVHRLTSQQATARCEIWSCRQIESSTF